jgi:tartronate-semialdehyde synthase
VGVHIRTRAGNEALLDADLVLAIGARFAGRHTGDLDVYRGERKFIHIDVDATQIGRVFGPDLGIVSDARLALEALLQAARRRVGLGRNGNAWAARVPHRRTSLACRDDHDDIPIKPQRVFRELNRHFGAGTVFVAAADIFELCSGQLQEIYSPRHYLICGQPGPRAWEVPACTGAKLGRPEATVVGVISERSFTAVIEELSVARRHAVPFVLVMLNTVHRMDHARVMEGMGTSGRRVEHPNAIGAALKWAVETSERHRRPALVEVITEPVEPCTAVPSLMG